MLRKRIIALGVICLGISAFVVWTAWGKNKTAATYGAGTTHSYEFNITKTPEFKTVAWQKEVGSIMLSDVITYENRLFYCTDDAIHAYDKKSGKELWSVEANFPKVRNVANETIPPIAVYNEMVFYPDGAIVKGVDIDTGKEKWSFVCENATSVGMPMIKENIMYFGTNEAYLYAVDMEKKIIKWKYKTRELPTITAMDEGLIYFNTLRTLTALNVVNGSVKWEKEIATVPQSISVGSSGLFIYMNEPHTWKQYLLCLNKRSGTEQWNTRENKNSASKSCLDKDTLYYMDYDYYTDTTAIHAISQDNGKEKWSYYNKCIRLSGFSLGEGRLYVAGSDGKLRIINTSNGKEDYWLQIDCQNINAPVVEKDGLYFIGFNYKKMKPYIYSIK